MQLRQLDTRGRPITSALAEKYNLRKVAADATPGTISFDVVATYRERMMLPANAVVETTLEEVSRADAPVTVLGTATLATRRSPPFQLTLVYDPKLVEPTRRYAVRARISRGNAILFVSDQSMPVQPGTGVKSPIDVLLVRNGNGGKQFTGATATLENTYWKLVALGDRAVTVPEGQREAHLILHPADHRVSGHGGCNALTGQYETKDDRLTFSKMAGTLRACLQGMDTERSFHEALGRASTWSITGEKLELRDVMGTVIARFESVSLR